MTTAAGDLVRSATDPILADLGVETLSFRERQPASKRLLVILAHPDDESFGMGSTLAKYTAEGVTVDYACATRGEAGEVSLEQLHGHADLGSLRTAELTYAAHELGLTAVHFLGYHDSGMQGAAENQHPRSMLQVPFDEMVQQLVALIRVLRPQVIVTFNSYGGYGHPDHIQIHRATVRAFGAAGDPAQYPGAGLAAWEPQKLYFHAFNVGLLRWFMWGMRLRGKDPRRVGVNQDIDLLRAFEEAGRVTTDLDTRAYVLTKERASAAHQSQGGGTVMLNYVPRRWRYQIMGREGFTRIVPPALRGSPPERDLFAGVTDQG